MGIIHTLDPHLANMIAAGEVVERPMGIVKELVENAIDAKATDISISLEQGGIDRIIIRDNGCGMDTSDSLLAFERHATSKIKDEQDLWRIHTMGFRGEALPSIASVAAVKLITNNGKVGTQIEIAWGVLKSQTPAARNQGTTIEVSQLFQKTPARLKHLKSANYEFSLVQDVIQKFALAHPEISFSVEHNEKIVFESKGKPELLTSIYDVYGLEIAKSMIEVQGSDQDYTVKGYIAQPSMNRANKYYILIYVNGRMVRNTKLTKVICDAYQAYLPQGRYPIVVLHLSMDYQLVDVNVHPSKWEIRLSKAAQLEELLHKVIHETLVHHYEAQTIRKIQTSIVQPMVEQISLKEVFNREVITKPLQITQEIREEEIFETKDEEIIETKDIEVIEEKANVVESEGQELKVHPQFPLLKVIGQLSNKYILAQGEVGLYIVDQHAAHERINYELLSKQFREANFHLKPLLVPFHFRVDVAFLEELSLVNEKVKSLGIIFEEFGTNSVVVREIPGWMNGSDEFALLTNLLEYLKTDKKLDIVELRKKAIETKACHQSIRFNRPLQTIEMVEVIRQLEVCEQPFHCPHGRPTYIVLDHKTLEKEFLRGG